MSDTTLFSFTDTDVTPPAAAKPAPATKPEAAPSMKLTDDQLKLIKDEEDQPEGPTLEEIDKMLHIYDTLMF